MTVQTYGIDQDYIEGFFPQMEIASTAVITPTTLPDLIDAACARVNGILLAHGLDPESVALDTGSETYTATRDLIITCIAPIFDKALLVDATQSEAACLVKITAFSELPQILGSGSTTLGPRVSTSVQTLGIDTSDTARAVRRSYGVGFKGW